MPALFPHHYLVRPRAALDELSRDLTPFLAALHREAAVGEEETSRALAAALVRSFAIEPGHEGRVRARMEAGDGDPGGAP